MYPRSPLRTTTSEFFIASSKTLTMVKLVVDAINKPVYNTFRELLRKQAMRAGI